MDKQFLTTKQLAEVLNCSPGTICNHRSAGTGPKFVKVFGSVRYDHEDVLEWLREQRFSNASEAREARRVRA